MSFNSRSDRADRLLRVARTSFHVAIMPISDAKILPDRTAPGLCGGEVHEGADAVAGAVHVRSVEGHWNALDRGVFEVFKAHVI